MSDDLNPQARQMADESMVRNLAAQAEAIWPQEVALLDRYGLPEQAEILDAGCGTGELTARLAERMPEARFTGIDIIEASLELARRRLEPVGDRARFEHRSIFDTGFGDGTFDLAVCRHVLQAVPHAERVIAELARVTRRGGRLHLLVEDYGMIHFPKRRLDPDEFWREGPQRFGAATGTDQQVGRHAAGHLAALGLADIRVDYVIVDTLRAPRETFAAIWTAWRDGYSGAIAQHTRFSEPDVVAHFDDMIATLRDPGSYAVWLVPVASAVVP